MRRPEREMSTDYEGRCGNCHGFLGEEDKYCRYCGTRRGEGAFEPRKSASSRCHLAKLLNRFLPRPTV